MSEKCNKAHKHSECGHCLAAKLGQAVTKISNDLAGAVEINDMLRVQNIKKDELIERLKRQIRISDKAFKDLELHTSTPPNTKQP